MGEPEGRTVEPGATETGAVLEGAENDKAKSSAGTTRSVGMPPLRGSAAPAGSVSLDLQVQADEPEQLMRLLGALAAEKGDDDGPRHREWQIIGRYASQAEEALVRHNAPRPR